MLAKLLVSIAWCIPGPAHRWAVRLRAERAAGLRLAEHLYPKRRGGGGV